MVNALIVENTRVNHDLLRDVLLHDTEITVVNTVTYDECNGPPAELALVDVVVLDAHTPLYPVDRTVTRLVAASASPVVAVYASWHATNDEEVARLQKAGASAVLVEPLGGGRAAYRLFAKKLRLAVKAAGHKTKASG